MSDDIPMQEVIDFFNTQARHAKIMAKAESVATALQIADGRLREAEAQVEKSRKEAARIIGAAQKEADSANAKLEALLLEVSAAECRLPIAEKAAADVLTKAKAQAEAIVAAANADAANITQRGASLAAKHREEEAQAKARAELALAQAAEAEAKREKALAALDAVRKQARQLAGA